MCVKLREVRVNYDVSAWNTMFMREIRVKFEPWYLGIIRSQTEPFWTTIFHSIDFLQAFVPNKQAAGSAFCAKAGF